MASTSLIVDPSASRSDVESLTYINRDAAGYLDGVATNLAALKARLVELLDPRPGHVLLDVGCGTGVDVHALSERVSPGGRVVGVDSAAELVAEATRRSVTPFSTEFRVADACALPFADGTFDASRSERVLQHVADPGLAVSELVRVTVPGGRVLVADPDHGMWAPDLSDVALTRKLMTYWVDHIRNPWMGRRLPGLLLGAGVIDLRVELLPIVLTSLAAADAVIGLADTAAAAVAQHVVTAREAAGWQDDLERRDSEGRFFLGGAIVVAHGRKAA